MSPDLPGALAPFSAAWQGALAAEQQAAFGYALLGPRLPAGEQDLAHACARAHETLRTDTQEAIAGAGLAPISPPADYPALYPVRSAAAARALAVRLEQDCAFAWRALYLAAASVTASPTSTSPTTTSAPASSATPPSAATARRTEAQQALDASTGRTVRWRLLSGAATATAPFPGS